MLVLLTRVSKRRETTVPAKRPTQADVAQLAGTSRSTVSLVLNRRLGHRISPATRQRVLEAMRLLGYTPHPAAQMLARGRHQIISVFTYEPHFPYEQENFYQPFLLGIEREASRQDYNVLLFTRHRHGQRRQIYVDGQNTLHLADGAILLGACPDRDELRRLVQEGYPFVYIGRREVPGCSIDWVASDYTTASMTATRHLLALGHRRLAFVGCEQARESYEDRLFGCQAAVAETSDGLLITLPERLLYEPQSLVAALRQSKITAVLCTTPEIIAALLPCLRSAGIRVPRDLSIVSLGDSDPPFIFDFSLTHVRLNRVQVGECAVRLLLDRLNGRVCSPQHIRVPCEFVVGESTAPPV